MFSLIYTAYVSLEHVVNIDYVLDSIPRFSIRVLEKFGVIRRRWVTNEEMIYCNHCAIFGHTANVWQQNEKSILLPLWLLFYYQWQQVVVEFETGSRKKWQQKKCPSNFRAVIERDFREGGNGLLWIFLRKAHWVTVQQRFTLPS